jgi:quinol monooxygenase YgiN
MADVHVFAKIQPDKEHYKEVLNALKDILVATRDEAGCERFELNTGIDKDQALYLVEIWSSAGALEAHHKMPHTMAAAKFLEGKLRAKTEVVMMTPAI